MMDTFFFFERISVVYFRAIEERKENRYILTIALLKVKVCELSNEDISIDF